MVQALKGIVQLGEVPSLIYSLITEGLMTQVETVDSLGHSEHDVIEFQVSADRRKSKNFNSGHESRLQAAQGTS